MIFTLALLSALATTTIAAPWNDKGGSTTTVTEFCTVTQTKTQTKTVSSCPTSSAVHSAASSTKATASSTTSAYDGYPSSVVGSYPKVSCNISSIPENQRLASLAIKDGNRYFGNAVTSWYFTDNQEYKDLLECQFDCYTPENEMKWEVIQPEQGVFNWTGADLIIAESKRTGSIVRGHNFCWNSQTPTYVTNITDPTTLKSVLKSHIDAVMGRYAQDLAYFDVINEPFYPNGTFQPSVWYDVLGADYVKIALQYAHEAAPNVKLCINDYGIEDVNNKSIALAALSKQLLAEGVPLHCIGFESHFIGGEFPGDISQSMNQFTDMGLEVPLTELDVRVPVNSAGAANSTELAQQAVDYAHAIGACLNNNLCPGVTIWEFSDHDSWVPASFPGQGAADIYNSVYQPKPAFTAVLSALQADSTAT